MTNQNHDWFSEEENLHLKERYRTANVWQAIFFGSTVIGIVVLFALFINIGNQVVSLNAVTYTIDPTQLSERPLNELDPQELIAILEQNLSRNRLRTLNQDIPLTERSQSDLVSLVMERVVDPTYLASWNLSAAIFDRAAIENEVASMWPEAHLEWQNWLTASMITNPMNSNAAVAGARTAIIGTVYLIIITILVAFPLGVGAAIYLEEYADKSRWINRIIQTNIDNLAGVPSIVYGILGLAIFVRGLEPITSGAVFGVEGTNGRTILSAGLTMALLILPVIIINSQEALKAVPNSLRQAGYGLGGTKWQTIWSHVLPYGLPGIMTGSILAISRAIGETAPLIVIGAATFLPGDPNGPFSLFTALPIQIYNWTTRPQDQWHNLAAAGIVILLVVLMVMNSVAILVRNHFRKHL